MSEDGDQTLISRTVEKVMRKQQQYDGEDKRAPAPITIGTLIPYAGAIVVMGGWLWGYAVLTSNVGYLTKELARAEATHKEDMASYLEWNKGISERLRHLERE